nr:unnamed protein product [Callosobruchus chinensis]
MGEKCRTCADSSTKMYHIKEKVGAYERTIEDMVLTLVPELKGQLQDSDVVCRICRRLLHQCLKFIERCFQNDQNLISISEAAAQEEISKRGLVDEVKKEKQIGTADDNDSDNEIFDLHQDEVNKVVEKESFQCTNRTEKHIESTAKKDDLTVEEQFEKLFAEEDTADDDKSDHDYRRKDCLAINKLETPPSSIVESHNRILSVKLPQNAPEQFVASLATIDVNVFGCSLNTEPSFENKRILLVGDYGIGVQCTDCEKVFTTKEFLEKHSVRHAKNRQVVERRKQIKNRKARLYRQKYRAAKLQRDEKRRKKVEQIKNKESSYMCEQCGKIFHQHAAYSTHKKIHRNGATLICHICGAVLKGSTSLRNHVESVHGERRYPCTLCPKVFKAEIHLKRHIGVTHMKQERVQCEECGKSCASLSALKGHRSLVHKREVKCICPICGAGLNRRDYLKRHMRKHMLDRKDPIPCKICNKTIIRAHMTTHVKCHKAERRFKCGVCGMTFKFKNNQLRHEKLHQKDPGKFKCHVCWKSFKNQPDYDEHMTHHNKTYTCPVCDEGFGRRFALKSHLYDIHPDIANSIVDTVDPRYPYNNRTKNRKPTTQPLEIEGKFKIIRKAIPKYEDEEPGEYLPEHDLKLEGVDEKSQDFNYDIDDDENYAYIEHENAEDDTLESTYQDITKSDNDLSMEEHYLEEIEDEEKEQQKEIKAFDGSGGDEQFEDRVENDEEELEGTYEEYIVEDENGERYLVKNEKYFEEEEEVC